MTVFLADVHGNVCKSAGLGDSEIVLSAPTANPNLTEMHVSTRACRKQPRTSSFPSLAFRHTHPACAHHLRQRCRRGSMPERCCTTCPSAQTSLASTWSTLTGTASTQSLPSMSLPAALRVPCKLAARACSLVILCHQAFSLCLVQAPQSQTRRGRPHQLRRAAPVLRGHVSGAARRGWKQHHGMMTWGGGASCFARTDHPLPFCSGDFFFRRLA